MPASSTRRHTQRNFIGIFERVLNALEFDYVGFQRYRMSGYSDFIGKLYTLNSSMFQSAQYCDRMLIQMLLHFIRWFQDPKIQLNIGEHSAWHPLYYLKAHRWEDALYVTDALEGAPVDAGTQIIEINGTSLENIYPEVERLLMTTIEPSDPEREDWSTVLAFARHLTVRNPDGSKRVVKCVPGVSDVTERLRARAGLPTLTLQKNQQVQLPHEVSSNRSAVTFSCNKGLQGTDVQILTIRHIRADFSQMIVPILTKLDCNAPLLVDVRACCEGELDEACMLIPLVLPSGTEKNATEVLGASGLITNWSRHNSDAKLTELQALKNTLDMDAQDKYNPGEDRSDMLAELEQLIEEIQSLRNKGLHLDPQNYFPQEKFYANSPVGATGKTYVLVDLETAGSAEWFAKAAQKMGSIVIGRATRGSIDNTCMRTVQLDDDFSLTFPYATYACALGAQGTLGRGIRPDVHIPWTPDHLLRDIDLEYALAFIRNKTDRETVKAI